MLLVLNGIGTFNMKMVTFVSSLTSYEKKGADNYKNEKGKEIKTPMVVLPKGKRIRLNITASDVYSFIRCTKFCYQKEMP